MQDLDFLADVARRAGEAILEVYSTEFEVERKEDESPLTLADTRSHRIIADALRSRYPDIPVLSEEGREVSYETRSGWPKFWLVDPLDGTKEFVKRNDEFTVNIGLIEGRTPVAGLIYIPVGDRLYLGDVREGCWEIAGGKRRALRVGKAPFEGPVRVVRSRSHHSPLLDEFLKAFSSYQVLARGSALKFCAVAAGEADFYPRLGRTWEWDTAAGQAIVTAAGGVMADLSGEPFLYNKSSLVNGPFLVSSSLEWLKETGMIEIAASLAARA